MLIRIYLFVLVHCFSYFCCLTANDLREEGLNMVYGSEELIPSSWGAWDNRHRKLTGHITSTVRKK